MRLFTLIIFALKQVNQLTLSVCRLSTILLVAGIAVVVSAGVIWRYFLNDSLSWTEESAKFLMVWLVFTGAPIALQNGGHAAIDVLPNLLPPKARQALFSLVYLIVIVLMVVLVYQGWGFALNARAQTTSTTQISMIYVFGAMPLGGVVMLLIAVELMLTSLRGIFNPDEGVHITNLDLAETSPE